MDLFCVSLLSFAHKTIIILRYLVTPISIRRNPILAMNRIKELTAYSEMISSLTRRELRGKYAKSVLGFLWSFLNPMFQILIYTIVFSVIFHNDMENYYIYLMTGLLPWTFFADSISSSAVIVNANAEMVKKIYFPREVLVIAEVNAKLINMLLSFIVMGVFILISGVGFRPQILFLPVLVLEEYLLTLGLALIIASITVYFRDMEYIINVILMAWIWGTPIMYRLDIVEGMFRKILMLNPMTLLITSYQNVFYWHTSPNVAYLSILAIEGLAVVVIGELVFFRLSKHFAEEL